ncbi:hypothetical protein [Stenotrophomonas sp. PS02298]|uniref:hypothetical protein n=1 Tax=Stenotrophomonas sp. PS02298 TaxID=2991424 RepID=UPI00249AD7E9|nr:hypothetical protein [Stenotrophomonas sp. PS02298]
MVEPAAETLSDVKPQLRRWACAFPEDLPEGATISSGDDDADRIEQIVRRMKKQGRWKEARVLRVEFVMGDCPEAERLHRLSRLGLRISRTSYYAYLQSARAFIEGVLLGELMMRDAANE